MRDEELEAIKHRHAEADAPSGVGGLRNISLVYSGDGRRAHDDRGALLAEIERLRGALKTAHDVFAADIEGLHKIILMNQPDYKRTVVASVDGL